MATTVFECARVPEGTTCSVKIVGERNDVVQAAHDHLAATHGLNGGDDLQQKVTRAIEEHQTTYAMWGG